MKKPFGSYCCSRPTGMQLCVPDWQESYQLPAESSAAEDVQQHCSHRFTAVRSFSGAMQMQVTPGLSPKLELANKTAVSSEEMSGISAPF